MLLLYIYLLSSIELILVPYGCTLIILNMFTNSSCLAHDRWTGTWANWSWWLVLRRRNAFLPFLPRCFGEATSHGGRSIRSLQGDLGQARWTMLPLCSSRDVLLKGSRKHTTFQLMGLQSRWRSKKLHTRPWQSSTKKVIELEHYPFTHFPI